ncbi:uncharacterized protein LOC109793980 [Cajanus cajan]|uniref:uncharacterized protein LOC109793980 n=1 Tax=Cajanus cajan TaxID=3821 RepID=UPI00098DAF96|nr:uncharacterized protein LOC109793980 [Cajanus cajan]
MNWLMEIEKIFNAMECPLAQKVRLATFMLTTDAQFWWEGALQRMIDGGVQLNWDNFKRGNDTVAEYAAKFDALVRYCTHYHGEGGEKAKCIKFVNGLRPEIKAAINYQEIYHYPTLVNKSRIYDHDNCARAIVTRELEIQGNHAKSRSVPGNSFVSGAASVRGSVSTPTSRCKKCGLRGHEHYNCPDKEITCFNCNGKGHISTQCPQPPRQRMTGT